MSLLTELKNGYGVSFRNMDEFLEIFDVLKKNGVEYYVAYSEGGLINNIERRLAAAISENLRVVISVFEASSMNGRAWLWSTSYRVPKIQAFIEYRDIVGSPFTY